MNGGGWCMCITRVKCNTERGLPLLSRQIGSMVRYQWSVIEKAHSRVLHIRSDDRADGPAIAPRLITSISPFPSPLSASWKGRYWVSSHPLLAQCVPTASPSLYANRNFSFEFFLDWISSYCQDSLFCGSGPRLRITRGYPHDLIVYIR